MKTDKKIARDCRCFFSRRNFIAALIVLAFLPRPSWADDVEKRLKFDYREKVLTLRHFYSAERLSFHSDGTLQGTAPVGPWTLDGQIEVEDVHLHGAQLEIKGRRIHLIPDAQHNLRDQLRIVESSNNQKNKELMKELHRQKVEIKIQLTREKPDEKEIASAINAVFLATSESMTDIVPSYWRAYFAKEEGKPQSSSDQKKAAFYKVGGGVTPPHVTISPEPEFSDDARKAKYQGTVVVGLVVDSSGAPTDLQIMRPIGMGLDEKAIAAISTWKFDPALKDGQPVAVAINVEVSFRLY